MLILGIHIDSPYIRLAILRKGRSGVEIRTLQTTPFLPTESNVKPLYTALGIENFNGRIASGIESKDFFVRSIELKMARSRHIEEAIAFQSEATSHFKPEDVLTVPLIQKKEKGSTKALLVTASREAISKHLKDLEQMQIDPDGVSGSPFGLYHFFKWRFPKTSNALVIDLGSSETTCILVENGELKKTHAILGGVESLLGGLLEDRKKILLKKEIEGAAKQIDLLLLKSGLNPNLSAKLHELRQEIAKVQYCFCLGKIPVIFTGRTDAFIHLREFLVDLGEEERSLSVEEQKHAISIGLALEQMHPEPLQFRLGPFFARKNWKKLGLYALSLITASCLAAAAILGFGMHASHLSKLEMMHSLNLVQEGKGYQSIDQWISAIEANHKEYPYILQAPRVSEFLAWLSSHPFLKQLEHEGDPIDLKEMRYQLMQYPKADSPKEPYLVKVELNFSFKNAMTARRFHEYLRLGDDLINPKLETTWDVMNDGYRTSFFLKNRSPYVP